MKDTLTWLVKQIVDSPQDVRIDEAETEGRTVLTISVNQEDMGKVIGKSGRIIRAIRDLMKVLATKKGIYVDVAVSDEEK